MKTRILFAALFLISVGLGAQQVISSGGGSFTQQNVQMSYTIGEPVTETFVAGEKVLTQGFHQTRLVVTSIETAEYLPFSISVFPNPTHNTLNIRLSNEPNSMLSYTIFDVNGKQIFCAESDRVENSFDVTGLAPGMYLLQIAVGKEYNSSYRIVKQ